jgi:hypothetical protein
MGGKMTQATSISPEQRAAGELLMIQAEHISQAVSAFSGWTMATVGAAIALILSHVDDITKYVSPSAFHTGMALFLWSVGTGAVARYLQSMVIALLAVTRRAEAYGTQLDAAAQALGRPFDMERFGDEYRKGLFPHLRIWFDIGMRKVKNGDFGASYRSIAKSSQLQVIFVAAQSITAISGCWVMVRSTVA